jgi:oxygen-dependent protoporphyrinogen oxidase
LGDKVRVNWKLTAIQKAGGGGYTLTYETPEGTITVGTKALVLTVPSYVASDILQPLSQGAADALSKFYYPPVAAVTISFPLSAIREDRLVGGELKGFGQLHPRSQGVQTLGMAAFLSSF